MQKQKALFCDEIHGRECKHYIKEFCNDSRRFIPKDTLYTKELKSLQINSLSHHKKCTKA